MVSGARCPKFSLYEYVMVRGAATLEGQMTYDSTQKKFLSWGLRGLIWGLKGLI